ncbi:MAG TPA: DUF5110 domain-containing protein, partial [Bacteroidales bacterium]|nr:DUF5110 domain-containing protein [Bacteroidales bacterium]
NFYNGGKVISADAPYERMPLFVKQGSVLPAGPEIQYTGEKTSAPVTLFIYTGMDGRFSFYEDEGVNYNYEKGDYSTIEFIYNDEKSELTIGERKGSFAGMPVSRTFNIVWIDPERPVPFKADAVPDNSITYTGKRVTIRRKTM